MDTLTVLFSDEPGFFFFFFRFCHMLMEANVTLQTARLGDGCTMAWARNHHGGRTALVRVASALTGIGYRDKFLQHNIGSILHGGPIELFLVPASAP